MAFRLETTKPSAIGAGLLAFTLSAALHVGLLRLNPNLLLGDADLRVPAPERRHRDIRLREEAPSELSRELPRLLDRFAAANPEPEDEIPMEPPGMEDPGMEAFQATVPEVDAETAAAPLLEDMPDVAEPESEWRPNQEVMAITEQRVREALDVLPRSFRDTRRDVPRAPDLSVPDGGIPDLPVGELSLPAAPALSFSDGEPGEGGIPELEIPGNDGGPTGGISDMPDLDLPELETREEITELDPVERLLRLETRVYVDPRNPEYRYFKIQVLRNGIEALPVMPRDVVFLLDCSASMTERKLREAVGGVRSALDTLSPSDTFNILAFREGVDRLFPGNVRADVVRKAGARTFLAGLHARGRTDVFASLEALRQLPHRPARPVQAFLVTDGVPTLGVTDTGEIIERFSRENDGRISMFGLGGGRKVNQLLLDFLSFRNRGSSLVVPRDRDLPGAILRMTREVSRPVLMDLGYRFTSTADLEVYPERLGHLHVDRPLILIGRLPLRERRVAFQMVGTSLEGEHDLIFTVDLVEAVRGSGELKREWAWQALLERMAEAISSPTPENLLLVRDLVERYGLEIPQPYRTRLEL